MAMLLDSVAPLVKMISLGSAPIRSATCCSEWETTHSQCLSLKLGRKERPQLNTQPAVRDSQCAFNSECTAKTIMVYTYLHSVLGWKTYVLSKIFLFLKTFLPFSSLYKRSCFYLPGRLHGSLALPPVGVRSGVRVTVIIHLVGQHGIQHPWVLLTNTNTNTHNKSVTLTSGLQTCKQWGY